MNAESQYWLERDGDIRGPYVFDIILTMWTRKELRLTDRIRANGNENWIEISRLTASLEKAERSKHSQGSRSGAAWRAGMTFGGGMVGLLVSYLMRPTIFGRGPSFGEWFTEGFNSPFASTIYTCGIIGLLVGFIIGYAIDTNAQKK
ncbi:MAG TPA: hypothetical protein VNP98_07970 [Chthoniobacterales bacterium]|nr:hypothetical protein [Chthoniobacterales bacterium]